MSNIAPGLSRGCGYNIKEIHKEREKKTETEKIVTLWSDLAAFRNRTINMYGVGTHKLNFKTFRIFFSYLYTKAHKLAPGVYKTQQTTEQNVLTMLRICSRVYALSDM